MATTRSKTKADKPPVLTQYVVLRAVPLAALDLDEAQRTVVGLTKHSPVTTLWMPVLNTRAEEGPDGHVRVVQAAHQAAAIRQVTGPDGPDILEGSWKAVALSSWRGGETTRRTMKSDRLPLDEAISS